MAAWREKLLCFNCDSKFVPGHKRNPTQFLCLMVDSDEHTLHEEKPPPILALPPPVDPPPEVGVHDTPSISLHALMGQLVPSTLKIVGLINCQEVIVLVDVAQ